MPRRRYNDYEPVSIEPVTFGPKPKQPDVEWLIEGFLPVGYLVLLAAGDKEGKTCLATAIALAVASGTPFAGLNVQRSNVLWFSLEESPDERDQCLSYTPEHIRKLLTFEDQSTNHNPQSTRVDTTHPATPIVTRAFSDSDDPNDFRLYQSYGMDPIDDGQSLLGLKSTLEHNKTKLIVIDPLHNATTGHSLQAGWDARRALNGLKLLCTRARVTAIVLHYVKERHKGFPRPAESAQLCAASSMVWVIKSTPLAQDEGRLVSLQSRGRGQFANRMWHFESSNPLDYRIAASLEVPTLAPETKQGNAVEEAIFQALGKGSKTTAELIDDAKLVPNTVRNALTRMYGRGDLKVVGVSSGARLYRVSRDSEWWLANHPPQEPEELDQKAEEGSGSTSNEKEQMSEESKESRESKESSE